MTRINKIECNIIENVKNNFNKSVTNAKELNFCENYI